jgi:transposase-like protein
VFVAVEDCPRDLRELEARFSTEEACREYLSQLRWHDGFQCLRCGGAKNWPKSEDLVRCAGCDYQVSVTAGTVFQDSRLPLTLWFRAAWCVTSQKNGVSAMGLQRVLGLRSVSVI